MALLTETFPGAPGGSNLALAQHELDDTEARLIQDGLVDRPGETRRRGPVTPVDGITHPTRPSTGLALTLDPLGTDRYAVLNGDSVNGYFSVYSDDLLSMVDLAWPHALPTDPDAGISSAYRIVDAKPGLTGGALIGVSSRYDANSPNQGIAYWRGGNKANYSVTVTVTRGSAAVTGTGFTANVAPGMFLFTDSTLDYTAAYAASYVGVVLQVNSDTSLTLGAVSPYSAAGRTGTFQSLRGLAPRVTKGRITTATDTTTVTGGSTKFRSQNLGTGTWDIFRRSDLTWVGQVSSVSSEISLILAANAAVAMSDEEYIALRADSDFSIINTANTNKVGFINAVWSERQWYFNLGAQFEKTYRAWFTDTNDPEALDLSEDGDWLNITSTTILNEPVVAAQAAHNALLVMKENETFGIFGTSPTNYQVRKVEDDGALSGMSVQSWGGGVIWAGRDGIHFYDGIQVENITAKKLGNVWKNSVKSFDPSKYRMWSMMVRDHYYVFIEDLDPTVAIVKGNVSSTPTSWGVMINMTTRAPVFLTNVGIRGAITLPASTGRSTWFLMNGILDGEVAERGHLVDADDLFDSEGADTVEGTGQTAGPDFFFESKKFNAGDSLRLKRYKQLRIHYLAQGGDINVDTVLGLNNIGQTLVSTFPQSVYTWDTLSAAVGTWDDLADEFPTWDDVIDGVYLPKRVKFMKKSQHLSFRLYQSASSMTRLKLGPYGLGYKLQRPGRVS